MAEAVYLVFVPAPVYSGAEVCDATTNAMKNNSRANNYLLFTEIVLLMMSPCAVIPVTVML